MASEFPYKAATAENNIIFLVQTLPKQSDPFEILREKELQKFDVNVNFRLTDCEISVRSNEDIKKHGRCKFTSSDGLTFNLLRRKGNV